MQKKGFGLMLKGYVNFFRKAIVLEKSPAALIIEAVQGLEGRGDEKVALSKFKEFLVDREGGYEGTYPYVFNEAYWSHAGYSC